MAQPPMNDKRVKVAYEILRYLIKNPDAQDTLKGIIDWWFPGRNTKYQKATVQNALDMMVEDGLVIANRGTYKLYRPPPKK